MKKLENTPGDAPQRDNFSLAAGRPVGTVVCHDGKHFIATEGGEEEVWLVKKPNGQFAWSVHKPVTLEVVK